MLLNALYTLPLQTYLSRTVRSGTLVSCSPLGHASTAHNQVSHFFLFFTNTLCVRRPATMHTMHPMGKKCVLKQRTSFHTKEKSGVRVCVHVCKCACLSLCKWMRAMNRQIVVPAMSHARPKRMLSKSKGLFMASPNSQMMPYFQAGISAHHVGN
jgi:hypothetical protein